jgi:hypothetical protein
VPAAANQVIDYAAGIWLMAGHAGGQAQPCDHNPFTQIVNASERL